MAGVIWRRVARTAASMCASDSTVHSIDCCSINEQTRDRRVWEQNFLSTKWESKTVLATCRRASKQASRTTAAHSAPLEDKLKPKKIIYYFPFTNSRRKKTILFIFDVNLKPSHIRASRCSAALCAPPTLSSAFSLLLLVLLSSSSSLCGVRANADARIYFVCFISKLYFKKGL